VTLVPRLDILPGAQRALWPAIAAVPRTFVLYGGTALALRLGHRQSIDFDFFTHTEIDHAALDALPFMQTAATLQQQPNTRTVFVGDGAETVKISFFGGLRFGRVGVPDDTDDNVVRVASVLDLAGTKIKALLQRVEAKDYLDIVALLEHGVALDQILGAARTLFGRTFEPLVAQKALCYFEGGDLDTLAPSVRERLIAAAAVDLDIHPQPRLAAELG
jgi:hypothetical protein